MQFNTPGCSALATEMKPFFFLQNIYGGRRRGIVLDNK